MQVKHHEAEAQKSSKTIQQSHINPYAVEKVCSTGIWVMFYIRNYSNEKIKAAFRAELAVVSTNTSR